MSIYDDYARSPTKNPYKVAKIKAILSDIAKHPKTGKRDCIVRVYGMRSDYGFALISYLTYKG